MNITLRHIFTIAFFLITLGTHSQTTFQRAYGSAFSELNGCEKRSLRRINNTNDGGYAICGSTQNTGDSTNFGVFFLKLDQYGDTIFSRTFKSNYSNIRHIHGRSVDHTDDGGYMLSFAVNAAYCGLIKTDSNGNIEWSYLYCYQMGAFSAMKLIDGNFILTPNDAGSFGLIKIDQTGKVLFGKNYQNTSNEFLNMYSTIECANGDLVSIGMVGGLFGPGRMLVVRTDSTGNILFSNTYGADPNLHKTAYNAVELSDNSIMVVGSANDTPKNIRLFKIDSLGNLIFHREIGDSYEQLCNSIVKNDNDEVFIAGATVLSSSVAGLFLKLDNLGNTVWSKRYDNSYLFSGLTKALDGGFVLAGITNKFGAGNQDVFIVKTDSVGDAGCDVVNHYLPNNLTVVNVTNYNLVVSNDTTRSPFSFRVKRGIEVNTKCVSVGVNESISNNKGVLYPNPTISSLTIDLKDYIINVQIFDFTGKLIESIFNHSNSVNVSHLISGIYFLKIETEAGIITEKFIKQ